jgi:hypothetical protein
MLPVLAAYMGMVKLESAEAYLSMMPERFWKQLSKLELTADKKHNSAMVVPNPNS